MPKNLVKPNAKLGTVAFQKQLCNAHQ